MNLSESCSGTNCHLPLGHPVTLFRGESTKIDVADNGTRMSSFLGQRWHLCLPWLHGTELLSGAKGTGRRDVGGRRRAEWAGVSVLSRFLVSVQCQPGGPVF